MNTHKKMAMLRKCIFFDCHVTVYFLGYVDVFAQAHSQRLVIESNPPYFVTRELLDDIHFAIRENL